MGIFTITSQDVAEQRERARLAALVSQRSRSTRKRLERLVNSSILQSRQEARAEHAEAIQQAAAETSNKTAKKPLTPLDYLKDSGIVPGVRVKVVVLPRRNSKLWSPGRSTDLGKEFEVNYIGSDGMVGLAASNYGWRADWLKVLADPRPPVRMLLEVHNKLTSIAMKTDSSRAKVFMLGKDPRTDVVVYAEKIDLGSCGGCHEMPSISASIMASSYVSMAKKGLHPCGLARVNKAMSNTPYWRGSSGPGVFNLKGALMLSYNGRIVIGQRVQNNKIKVVPYTVVSKNKKGKEVRKYAKKSSPQKRRGFRKEDQGSVW